MSQNNNAHEASFRDPSGYIFIDNGVLKRRVNSIYFPQFEALSTSGFFNTLIEKKLLIGHQVLLKNEEKIILQPEVIPFITQPYEWCFEQYKHAALLTLQIHKYALSKNFILKDASAYNVTFHKGKPIFIDTLSFDFYEENTPWRAYKQFITHFFGPLVLAKYHGPEILKLMQNHIDGIPVALISSLLPAKTKFNATLYTNIHLLAKMENKYSEDYKAETKKATLSKKAQQNILESLFKYIKSLSYKGATEWGEYYNKTNYNEVAFNLKKDLVKKWVLQLSPKTAIDIGGNDGTFARTFLKNVPHVMVTDIDPNAVGLNYAQVQQNREENMLPFLCDVLQPAPSIGFFNKERASLITRLKAFAPEVTLALALIHHITLSGNVPFIKSASFFAAFSKHLIIEFPKREDSWVTSLLTRKREFINHFNDYNQEQFEKAYLTYFNLVAKQEIENTERVLFHFQKKDH